MQKTHLSRFFMGRLVCALSALFFMASCIGVKLDVKAGRNGSGDMELEYRLKKELVEFASFGDEGDEPPIPLTREDFETSIGRINGLSIKSYTHKKDDFDYIYKTKIHFESFDALVLFLTKVSDGAASYTQRGGKNEFTYFFWNGRGGQGSSGGGAPRGGAAGGAAGGGSTGGRAAGGAKSGTTGTAEMFRGAFDGYTFDFNISLPSSCEAYYINGEGGKLSAPPSGAAALTGKSFSISAPMADVFLAESPAAFVLVW